MNDNQNLRISAQQGFRNPTNQDKFIVIVPEFSNDYFPDGDSYNLANIFTDGDNPSSETLNPSEQWTFAVLDPLFIYFKSCCKTVLQPMFHKMEHYSIVLVISN
mgnify:CR=1 FL=1